jgi:ABC-type multidrug transport system fused ATPase/permease subunit
MRLPRQYETELGERGAKLWGGERQRLCVARAFLKDAPILILDEPTSAIDSKTEAVILEALDRLMIGRAARGSNATKPASFARRACGLHGSTGMNDHA